MNQYEFTPQAEADLFDIWAYIAEDSRASADRVLSEIREACSLAADNPMSGSVRKEFTDKPLRFWLVNPRRRYFLVYDAAKKPLRIVRVLHAARDVSREL
jgi:plasmid stabilization system protein ParE